MRRSLLAICAVAIALCFWVFLRKSGEIQFAREVESKVQTARGEGVGRSNSVVQAREVARSPVYSSEPGRAFKTPRIPSAIEQLVQKPINFYGKVLDQSSNAVAGATVQFRWEDFSAGNWTQTTTTQSDSEGRFALRDKHGSGLNVLVSKDGYYSPKGAQGSFDYASGSAPFSPDAREPVVFYLRTKGKGASLVVSEFPTAIGKILQLHHDGTPIEFDLLGGKQTPAGSGQLKLELWRDDSDVNASKFDWKLQLSAVDGGLVPTDEEFAFEPPASGYQPSIVIDMPATNENWLGELRTKYYIQLPNGNYGRIDFYLLPYNGAFTVHSYVNPSGSRNLER